MTKRTARTRKPKPRPFSQEFSVSRDTPRIRYEVDRIPPQLLARMRRATKRAHVSLRTLTLQLWTSWLAEQDIDRANDAA